MKKLINYIFPNKCLTCSDFIDEGAEFCAHCWNKMHFIKEPRCSICSYQFEDIYILENQTCLNCKKSRPKYDFNRCLLKYDESSKKLIHNLKYYDKTIISKPLTRMLASKYYDEIKDSDMIIPVPMHKYKRIFRLYNHAQILASDIGNYLNKKVVSDILLKIKNTKPQSSLTRNARIKNLSGAFYITRPEYIKNKKILLVDDVVTTGITASLCAGKLKKAGAKSVVLLSIARRML